ncbi:MAG: tetratricopeptide repeat protein [Planctomycetota bacterium]|jgi:tetratricopeptide (TPR) repeat protein
MSTVRRTLAFFCAASALALVAGGCRKRERYGGYAGSSECRPCHEEFYKKWATSHHGRAMQPYTPELARAEMEPQAQPIEVGGAKYRADVERGVVIEEKPSGTTEYRMLHTMGGKNVFYFLTPMERGHLQVLPVAYDVREEKWFDTAASAVRHFADRTDRPLHWTDRMYTFNTACHGCHVSQIERSYDAKTDSYKTTWGEPGINCETCHGPGAEHIAVCRAATKDKPPADLKTIRWDEELTVERQNDACASCHAKFMILTDEFRPGDRFFDHYDLACFEDSDFHPDGRDLGENYTLTSWRMSPCAKSGKLRCTHCHTSSGRYRFDEETANNACLPCHAERVADVKEHARHKPGTPGSRCVSCHMPTTQFGGMRRSDHSMRPPTPAATLEFKSPNACNICHHKKKPSWADKFARKRFGKEYQAPALERARLVLAARGEDVRRLDDILARISAPDRDEVLATSMVRLLSGWRIAGRDRAVGGKIVKALVAALGDPSPLVRSAAAAGLAGTPRADAVEGLLKATKDEYRLVRVRAAQALSRVPEAAMGGRDLAAYRKALEEYLSSLRTRPDMWSNHYNMGNYHMDRGDLVRAAGEFEAATRLRPDAVPALVNAAMAYARLNRNADAKRALGAALKSEPASAAANFNMGLLQAELGDTAKAEKHLRAALKAEPDMAQAAYNLGVLLCKRGGDEGFALLGQACKLDPSRPRYAYTHAFFLKERGRVDEAIRVLGGALALHPSDAQTVLLAAELLQKTGRPERAKEVLRRALDDASLPPDARIEIDGQLKVLDLVIRKAGTARLHSGQEKRFSCLEESLAVPLRNCQTQPSGRPPT